MAERKGFTLIEVLIVLLIIGILTTIAIPLFNGLIVKARFPEMLVRVRQYEQDIDEVFLGYGWTDEATNKAATIMQPFSPGSLFEIGTAGFH